MQSKNNISSGNNLTSTTTTTTTTSTTNINNNSNLNNQLQQQQQQYQFHRQQQQDEKQIFELLEKPLVNKKVLDRLFPLIDQKRANNNNQSNSNSRISVDVDANIIDCEVDSDALVLLNYVLFKFLRYLLIETYDNKLKESTKQIRKSINGNIIIKTLNSTEEFSKLVQEMAMTDPNLSIGQNIIPFDNSEIGLKRYQYLNDYLYEEDGDDHNNENTSNNDSLNQPHYLNSYFQTPK